MRRAAAALVAFVVLEYFGPLTPTALTFFTLAALTEVAGVAILRRRGQERAARQSRPSRLQTSH